MNVTWSRTLKLRSVRYLANSITLLCCPLLLDCEEQRRRFYSRTLQTYAAMAA